MDIRNEGVPTPQLANRQYTDAELSKIATRRHGEVAVELLWRPNSSRTYTRGEAERELEAFAAAADGERDFILYVSDDWDSPSSEEERFDDCVSAVLDKAAEQIMEEWGPSAYDHRSALRRRLLTFAGQVATTMTWDVAVQDAMHRYLTHWAIAHAPPAIDGETRLFLHAITLRVDAEGSPTCTAGVRRLALDTSLSESTVYERLSVCAEAGWLQSDGKGRCVTLRPDDAQRGMVHKLWRAELPEPDVHAAWRWNWERALVQRSQLPTSAKGLGMAFSQITDSSGRPRTWTTLDHLQALSGYSRKTVHEGLALLEREGWAWVRRQRGRPPKGRAGNLLVGLMHPQRADGEDLI